ncbi:putative small nuclear ribonucleoprotein-associated protein B [Toxocara canis]|uniref:Sm protein B n=1 Tax=Toxocara canis TaxID=6265 RepID=A0A0B2VQL5_TOXCA|nr:putative small nuclear ribonucleoprotein-associated protein B [Toxocara canis]
MYPVVLTISKNNKMMAHLNYRMKVALQDSRTFVGYFRAFDKHMNILLSDCEEYRTIKPKPGKKNTVEEEMRTLGLVLLRGEHIVSMTVDGPPPKEDDSVKLPKAGGLAGPGVAKPAGRGVPMVPPVAAAPPPGLQGAVRGIGGPGMSIMQPGYAMPPPMQGMPPRPPGPF